MKNEIWLPEGTEILTSQGWLPIEDCLDGSVYIMGPLKGKITKQRLKSFAKLSLKCHITDLWSESGVLSFHRAFPVPKHEIFKSFEDLKGDYSTFIRKKKTNNLVNINIPGEIIIIKTSWGEKTAGERDLSDESDFTQDDYEDGNSPSFVDAIFENSIIKGTCDYWFSRTRW